MLDGDLITGLIRIATNYRRGVFCPAELWVQVVHCIADHDAESSLVRLPRESQEILRDAYRERPRALRSESVDDGVRQVVERWCLRPDD